MATAVSSDGKAINNMEHSDMFRQKLVAIEEQTDAVHADMEEAKLTARKSRRPWLKDHWIADWGHCGRYKMT